MKIVLLLNSVGRFFFAYILYLSNLALDYSRCTLCMDDFLVHCCIILHPAGKYIVIKVEYGLQLHFKIFPYKSD